MYEVANGEIPRDDLDVIPVLPGESQRHALNPVAAEAYAKMVAAAKEDGVEWGITDSYRPLEVQVRLAKQKGLYSQGGLAAAPGTSNHGWGSAVDLNFKVGKGNQFQWLKDNASNFGFNNIPREPWHWEHKESAKQVKGGNLPSTNTPPPSGKTVAPTTSSGSSALLKIGVTGEEVTKVQAKLGVTQSGNYDAATDQAVRKFQSENKDTSGAPLKVDGIVGPITYGALFGVQISPEVIAKASPTQVNQVNQVGLPNYTQTLSQGKININSNKSAPLIVVFGGIDVGGRSSGSYMYDYFKEDTLSKATTFIANSSKIDGSKAWSEISGLNLTPAKKILYLFSGGYLPGMSLLAKVAASEWAAIYLVDIWIGQNANTENFYTKLTADFPDTVKYYYTGGENSAGGSNNLNAKKKMIAAVNYSKSAGSHMGANDIAVNDLRGDIS